MAAITISVYICLVTDISQYTLCLNLIVGSANEKKCVDMPVMEQDYVEQCYFAKSGAQPYSVW